MGRFGLHSLACAVIPDEFSMKPDDKSANLRNAPRHNLRLGYSRDVLNQNVVREFLERQALLMRVFADAVTKATADMRQFAEWARLLHYQQRARHAAKQFRRVTEWKQQS